MILCLFYIVIQKVRISFYFWIDLCLMFFSSGLILFLNYSLVTVSNNASGIGQENSNVFSYYFLAFILIVLSWTESFFAVSNRISRGKILHDLVRPIPILLLLYANSLSDFFVNLILAVPLITYAVFRGLINIQAIPCFLFLGFSVFLFHLLFNAFLGSFAWFFQVRRGVYMASVLVLDFVSGNLFPYSKMPPLLANILKILPFRFIASDPILFLQSGMSSTFDLVKIIFGQLPMIIVLILLTRLLFSQARVKGKINV